jgi:hypothetical protein
MGINRLFLHRFLQHVYCGVALAACMIMEHTVLDWSIPYMYLWDMGYIMGHTVCSLRVLSRFAVCPKP